MLLKQHLSSRVQIIIVKKRCSLQKVFTQFLWASMLSTFVGIQLTHFKNTNKFLAEHHTNSRFPSLVNIGESLLTSLFHFASLGYALTRRLDNPAS